MRLGKQEYKFDARTLKLANFIDTEQLVPPPTFDFDKNRAKFPQRVWGNDAYGDCVLAAQMNHVLRMERLETRHTVKATDDDVIREYQALTGCRQPNDANDNGLNMLDTLKWWRHDGWTFHGHNYKIEAFGELDSQDLVQLRLGTWLFHGIQFGFALPLSAKKQWEQGDAWDVTYDDSRPGSWGGHAVYGKKYTPKGWFVETWGEHQFVTNEFITNYCDEAWAPIDALDPWRKTAGFDVAALEAYLVKIGARQH